MVTVPERENYLRDLAAEKENIGYILRKCIGQK
jgi:hypothetical protein